MNKKIIILSIFLLLFACKDHTKVNTVPLSELEKIPMTHIQIIDGEIMFERTGFLKIKTELNNWIKITQTTEKGVFVNRVKAGEYATIIIEEIIPE
jgi:hypothetical protein